MGLLLITKMENSKILKLGTYLRYPRARVCTLNSAFIVLFFFRVSRTVLTYFVV